MGSSEKEGEVGHGTGIMAAQLELNKLHKSLADEGFNQVHTYVHMKSMQCEKKYGVLKKVLYIQCLLNTNALCLQFHILTKTFFSVDFRICLTLDFTCQK